MSIKLPVSESNRQSEAMTLKAADVCKTLSDGQSELRILNNINLQMRQGEFAVIVGPSGSGKTTLLSILGAMDTATSGSIIIGGADLSGMSESNLAVIRNQKIGMVFQFFNLLDQVSVLANVELPMRLGGLKDDATPRAMDLLGAVGLAKFSHRLPINLSGGERQRLAVARALANAPLVVLADEPTGNLDDKTSQEVLELLVGITVSRGSSLLIVTHDNRICSQANSVYQLENGVLRKL